MGLFTFNIYIGGKKEELNTDKRVSLSSELPQSEWITIWEKPNGIIYEKHTKHKPFTKEMKHINVGYVNDYGHKVLNCYEQSILNI